MKRPIGVTAVGVLTFFGAAILALGSFAFFFVAVMAMRGGDAGERVSVALVGPGLRVDFPYWFSPQSPSVWRLAC